MAAVVEVVVEAAPAVVAPAAMVQCRPAVTGAQLPVATGAQLPVAAGVQLPVAAGAQQPVATGAQLPVAAGAQLPVATGSQQPVATGAIFVWKATVEGRGGARAGEKRHAGGFVTERCGDGRGTGTYQAAIGSVSRQMSPTQGRKKQCYFVRVWGVALNRWKYLNPTEWQQSTRYTLAAMEFPNDILASSARRRILQTCITVLHVLIYWGAIVE